jgi:hypothetical protein
MCEIRNLSHGRCSHFGTAILDRQYGRLAGTTATKIAIALVVPGLLGTLPGTLGLDEPVQRPRAEPSGGGGQQCAAATGNGGCGGGLRGQRLDADEQGQKTKDAGELFLPKIDVR